jgi:hypothetical protein
MTLGPAPRAMLGTRKNFDVCNNDLNDKQQEHAIINQIDTVTHTHKAKPGFCSSVDHL